jgi:hypothetical protein
MHPLFAFILQHVRPSRRDPRARDEAYLSQAADMADLERRIRQLDRGQRDGTGPQAHGIFTH